MKLVFLFWHRNQTSSFAPLLWSADGLHGEVWDMKRVILFIYLNTTYQVTGIVLSGQNTMRYNNFSFPQGKWIINQIYTLKSF